MRFPRPQFPTPTFPVAVRTATTFGRPEQAGEDGEGMAYRAPKRLLGARARTCFGSIQHEHHRNATAKANSLRKNITLLVVSWGAQTL